MALCPSPLEDLLTVFPRVTCCCLEPWSHCRDKPAGTLLSYFSAGTELVLLIYHLLPFESDSQV